MDDSGIKTDGERRRNYCVLYTPSLEEDKVRKIMRKTLPEGRGILFSPCMETYFWDAKEKRGDIKLKAIFPGYLFILSDMTSIELHGYIQKYRQEFISYVRELGFNEHKMMTRLYYWKDSENKDFEYSISDLGEKESRFIDYLLDMDGAGGKVAENVMEALRKRDGTADLKAVHMAGLLKMSYGYKEKDKWHVVKGPLRAYEDHIISVNKREKKALLNFEVGKRTARAGFIVKPKRYWFPDDENAPQVLADGSELDLNKLKMQMNSLGRTK
ncbi:MAG: hypothetical protein IJ682_13065 [Lachnospiraceae bacterium]|nr:hypothetical protein [Lachnospiraceae bacterium]